MDHLPFGMFADADAYDAREEMAGNRGDDTAPDWMTPSGWIDDEEDECDGDYIPGLDDGEWIEDGEQE